MLPTVRRLFRGGKSLPAALGLALFLGFSVLMGAQNAVSQGNSRHAGPTITVVNTPQNPVPVSVQSVKEVFQL